MRDSIPAIITERTVHVALHKGSNIGIADVRGKALFIGIDFYTTAASNCFGNSPINSGTVLLHLGSSIKNALVTYEKFAGCSLYFLGSISVFHIGVITPMQILLTVTANPTYIL